MYISLWKMVEFLYRFTFSNKPFRFFKLLHDILFNIILNQPETYFHAWMDLQKLIVNQGLDFYILKNVHFRILCVHKIAAANFIVTTVKVDIWNIVLIVCCTSHLFLISLVLKMQDGEPKYTGSMTVYIIP